MWSTGDRVCDLSIDWGGIYVTDVEPMQTKINIQRFLDAESRLPFAYQHYLPFLLLKNSTRKAKKQPFSDDESADERKGERPALLASYVAMGE